MADRATPRRRYDSRRRREQAEGTRRAILEAAGRLFERHGYAATTMAAIAGEAGVALKTVYLAFETKAGVQRATDILWALNLSNLWQLLVAERGWTPEQYEAWIGDAACTGLLRD